MRSMRRALTPLALIIGLLFAQRIALAAGPAAAPVAKVRTPAQMSADQARSDKMKAKWADPAQAAAMVKARHGGNAPAAKSYRMKAQWADPAAAAKLAAGRHGGNATSAKSYRAKAQWADPAKRQALLDGQARGRANRTAANTPTPAAEEPVVEETPAAAPAPAPAFAPPTPAVVRAAPAPTPMASPAAVTLNPNRGRGFSIASRFGLGRFARSGEVNSVVAAARRTAGDGSNRAALTRAIEMLPTEGTLTAREWSAINGLRGQLQNRQAQLPGSN